MNGLARKKSYANWTANKRGIMRNKELWVAARTVFARSESRREKAFTKRQADTAPRIAAAAEAPVMDGCTAQ